MYVDRDKILKRLEAKKGSEKGPVTLYLTKAVYAQFKQTCGKVPPSSVVEEMMLDFIEQTPGKKKS